MRCRARLVGLLVAGSTALMLPACSAAPAGGSVTTPPGSSMPASPTTTAAASAPTEASCNAQAVQDLVGRHASGLIAEGARQRAGAQRVRMIGHDEMVTKEYDAGRLNLQLDAQGRVARVYCG